MRKKEEEIIENPECPPANIAFHTCYPSTPDGHHNPFGQWANSPHTHADAPSANHRKTK